MTKLLLKWKSLKSEPMSRNYVKKTFSNQRKATLKRFENASESDILQAQNNEVDPLVDLDVDLDEPSDEKGGYEDEDASEENDIVDDNWLPFNHEAKSKSKASSSSNPSDTGMIDRVNYTSASVNDHDYTYDGTFVLDLYRRFIRDFGTTVLKIDACLYDALLLSAMEREDVQDETALSRSGLLQLLEEFKVTVLLLLLLLKQD